ncbi:MAG: hypothetical protein M3405_01230 [Acidobacteriota bacterium]|nr:hypothetical protein [Acidobacteriota bacterium]
MNRSFIICVLTFFIIIGLSCNGKGKIVQTYTKNINDNYLIRVNGYAGKGLASGMGFYTYESINKKSNSETEIFTFIFDGIIYIKKENIIIKNENLAYFWMSWKFAVTDDGGKTWSVWNGKDYDEFDSNYGLIEKVEIDENGNGKMFFNQRAIERKGISFLITKDFGKTWQKP